MSDALPSEHQIERIRDRTLADIRNQFGVTTSYIEPHMLLSLLDAALALRRAEAILMPELDGLYISLDGLYISTFQPRGEAGRYRVNVSGSPAAEGADLLSTLTAALDAASPKEPK